MEKLRAQVQQELTRINGDNGNKLADKEIEQLFEDLVSYLDSRSGKPYETTMAELDKVGIVPF